MTLEEAAQHIDDAVTYTPSDGADYIEHGVITAVGSRYVFVRYGRDRHSKATAADRIHLVAGGR